MKTQPRLSAPAVVFLAQFVSIAGDRMFAIAIAWWVVSQEQIPNRELTLGLLLAASTLPAALTGPLIGPLIDRFNRRTCMLIADAIRLLIMVVLAALLQLGQLSVPALFALCIPLFALEPLFESAVSASLASIARDALSLERLVALESALPNMGAVAGAFLAGVALSAWNIAGAFWFNALSFLISLILVSRLPSLMPKQQSTHGHPSGRGYRFLTRHTAATRLLALFAIINFFEAPVLLYLPLLTRGILQGDGATLSFLEMAFAAGNLSILAFLFLSPRQFSRTRWLRFFLVALSAVCLGLLGILTELRAFVAVLLMGGVSVGFVSFLAISSFQRTIPDEFKGRFFALLNSLCTIGMPLSFACFGVLSSRLPLQELILANGLCALVVSLGFLSVPDEPSMRPENSDHQAAPTETAS